jgi:DNA-binding CsgD family transcriptional regulator
VSEERTNTTLPQLSERELEILRLVASGLSNKEIAAQLVLSPNTVKVHLRNIFGKIGVQSRTEATMVAVRQGWVSVPTGANATPVTEEPDADAESKAEVETGLVTRPRVVEPPLPWWQRITLVVVLALRRPVDRVAASLATCPAPTFRRWQSMAIRAGSRARRCPLRGGGWR